MKTYLRRLDGYECGLLEPDDWQLYRQVIYNIAKDAGELDDEAKFDLDHSESHIRERLSSKTFADFCIIKDNKPIGFAYINMDEVEDGESPYFNDVYVLQECQGYRLVNMLYQSLLVYAADETDSHFAVMDIADNNRSAKSAAFNNGFERTEESGKEDGITYYRYQRDLDSLRSEPLYPSPNP